MLFKKFIQFFIAILLISNNVAHSENLSPGYYLQSNEGPFNSVEAACKVGVFDPQERYPNGNYDGYEFRDDLGDGSGGNGQYGCQCFSNPLTPANCAAVYLLGCTQNSLFNQDGCFQCPQETTLDRATQKCIPRNAGTDYTSCLALNTELLENIIENGDLSSICSDGEHTCEVKRKAGETVEPSTLVYTEIASNDGSVSQFSGRTCFHPKDFDNICSKIDPVTFECIAASNKDPLPQMCGVNSSGIQVFSDTVSASPTNSITTTAISTPSTNQVASIQNNSLFATAQSIGTMGKGRIHSLNRTIESDGTTAILHRQDTRQLQLTASSVNGGNRAWTADADIQYELVEHQDGNNVTTGWTLTLDDKTIEQYNENGRLESITNRNGFTRTLTYENDLLKTVTDHFGRALNFEYTDGLMSKVIDPALEETVYGYDSEQRLETITSPDGSVKTYLFEDANHPNSITGIEENGVRTATYTYQTDGKVKTSELAGGVNKVEMAYNEDGTTTVIDALGAERTYEFETILGVKKVKNVTGDTCASCGANINRREYDAIGNVKLSENANGHITTFLYDDPAVPDLPTSRTEAVGTAQERTTTTEWNAELRLPKKVTRTGQTVEFDYNTDSQLKTVTVTDTSNDKQQITTFDYHPSKLLKSIDGSRTDVNDIATFEYDYQGNRTGIRNALDHLTQLQDYDAHGRARKVIDSNELITTIQYDVMGRIKQTTTGTETTVYTYDPIFGLLETVTSADDSTLTLSYNDAKQLTQVKDQHGNTITFDPDAKGNVKKTEVKDEQGNLVSTASQAFNKLSQLESTLGGEGQIQGFTYDDLGNLKTSHLIADNAQPDNKQNTQYFYDALERQNKIIDAKDGETIFTFDERDNLKTVTDPNGNTTEYLYDGFDNVTEQKSPDTGTSTFTYDEANNVKTQLDNKQQLTQLDYDVLNRVIDISYDDGQTEHYDYDQGAFAKGRVNKVTSNTLNGNIDYSVTYNNMGRLETSTQTVDGINATLTYVYNSKGQLESLTYPSGKQMVYGYANGELVSMSIDGTPLINNIKYEAFGSVNAWDWGSGLKHSRTFDLAGRLETHSLNQDTRTIGYNDADDIKKLEDAAGSRDYNYDELHRLIAGTHLGQALLYDYDPNSNRLLSSIDGEQTDYLVDDASNQITQIGNNTIEYDANGNISNDGINHYAYDAKNRFINFNNGQVLYTHNAFGLRVKKTFPANAPNAVAANTAQSAGNHIEDDFTGSDDTDILSRADNTWTSNNKGSALIKGNQANLTGGIALSQTVGTLNENDSYTLNAKLTQGEISISSNGAEIANIRYGFSNNLFITIEGMQAPLNVNTSIPKDRLSINVQWQAGQIAVTATGTDGTEYTTGIISNSNIAVDHVQSVKLRDYFTSFYVWLFGNTVFIDDVTVIASNTPTDPEPEPVNNDRLYHYNDAGLLTTEFDGDGSIIIEHIYLGSTPIAVMKNNEVFYVHTDHLGTPRSITRQNNTVVWGWESKPFGDDAVTDLIGLGYSLRMAGQFQDQESGLFYNWNRTYNPETGRYLESDPIGLSGGLNTYGYVGGNPNSFVDSMGLHTEIVVWQPIGWGGSSFGHISGQINGRNYSFGTGGWDTKYPNFKDYAKRQQEFRGGVGNVLDLTPQEEVQFEQCLKKSITGYDFILDNCSTPFKDCLRSIGVKDAGYSLYPADVGEDLKKSTRFKEHRFYPSTYKRSFPDDGFWVK